jgi:hypothetical protein
VQKLREWAERDGLTMLLGGSNTGVSIAMSAVVKERKIPFFAIGAAGASLTGKDCTPYTVHYLYDTTALGNGAATAIVGEGGLTWFFVTADYASARNCRREPRMSFSPMAARSSARCALRSTRRISPPSFCRRNNRARKCSAWRMLATTSPTL